MNTPERDPSAGAGSMDGNHCYTWKKGEGSGGGSTVGGGKFCPAMAEVKPLGPGRFSAPSKRGAGVQVGDQFLSMVWKGFTYTIANSSAVTTQDVGVHAGGYMVSLSTIQHDVDMHGVKWRWCLTTGRGGDGRRRSPRVPQPAGRAVSRSHSLLTDSQSSHSQGLILDSLLLRLGPESFR